MRRIDGLDPREGPAIITIPGIANVQIGAGVNGAIVQYRWPRDYVLRAWMLVPTSATRADAATLRIRMRDEMGNELVSDTQGIASTSNFAPVGALLGLGPWSQSNWWAPSWKALRRAVRAGELWTFQVFNGAAAPVTPWLGFELGALPKDVIR